MKKRFAILKNETINDHIKWVEACEKIKEKIDYDVIDFLDSEFVKKVIHGNYDMVLAKPPGISTRYKELYDEKILLLSLLNIKVYPSPLEIYIYENKRFLYSWLEANKLPHPNTKVFHNKEFAYNYLRNCSFPVVAKTNIGASGSGVKILKSEKEALKYITLAFSGKGAPKRWGPNLEKGNLLGRGLRYLMKPNEIKRKVSVYLSKKSEKQTNLVLFQQYVPHSFEWRVVAIGDSYFAHKKLKTGDKASGSLIKQYDQPSAKLLDFAKDIMEQFGFLSQALDIFENEYGVYYINELQCIFGQSDPYQMLIDGKPGRFIFKNKKWVFEKGMFNQNESYDLRIAHAMQLVGIK